MRWILTFNFLHILGICFNIPADKIITTTDLDWLCSSTMGCSMTVGLNDVHFDNMSLLCSANNVGKLASALGMERKEMTFTCAGSKRCCTQCRLPLPPARTNDTTPIVVSTQDELRMIFFKCLVVMSVALFVEVLVGVMLTCSKHPQRFRIDNCYEESQRRDDLDTAMGGATMRRKVVCLVSTAVGLASLATEMCLLIALVLVPAVSYMRTPLCFISVVRYAIAFLAAYTCMGVLIDRYIAIRNRKKKVDTCIDTCISNVILSIMGSAMWLVTICGLIIGAIYCGIVAIN
jgi:hypothetical protein